MKTRYFIVAMLMGFTITLGCSAEVVAYVAALVEDSVMRLHDLNHDGDYHDAGEATQFFGPGNADGFPGVGSAQTLLTLGFDDILAGDGEDSGEFETRIYRLRDLNGDGDAMDIGEANVFFDSILPIGVNFDRPKEMQFGPDGAIYLLDNNTINFDNDTPEAIWRLEDLNRDGDVNDPGEVTLVVEFAPAGNAFAFITEDFRFLDDGLLSVSNQHSSSNTGSVWMVDINAPNPSLSLMEFVSDDDLLGLELAEIALTLAPDTNGIIMSAVHFDQSRRIVELIDANGDGVINSNREVINRYHSGLAAEQIVWNEFNVTDIDYDPDGALWLLDNGDEIIYRFVDLTGDGQFFAAGEAGMAYDMQQAMEIDAFVTEFPRTIVFAEVPDEADPADFNGDGTVNGADLLILLNAWGPCPAKTPCPADLDGDDAVAGGDLLLLLNAWG